MAAAVVAVVAGEVAVAVVEAAEVVVVCFTLVFLSELKLTCSGWTGGNNDPVRNSRW
jgi:hypothetical protein